MKNYTKLRISGIVLIILPILILVASIFYQRSQMEVPDWEHLNLRWGFVAFYAMAAGLVLLIFAREFKRRELKNEENQNRYMSGKND